MAERDQLQATAAWLEMATEDFLAALRRLQPGRMLKSYLGKELQIGLLQGEAVFCIEGAQTRRPAQGRWNGFACLPYGMLLPYLKVKPEGEAVRLTYQAGRMSLGHTRFRATWMEASSWISQLALDAHFIGPLDAPAPKRFCPACGRREGVLLAEVVASVKPSQADQALLQRWSATPATHGCPACLHGWGEWPGRRGAAPQDKRRLTG